MSLDVNGHKSFMSKSSTQSENEIKKYLRILQKKKWLILAVTIIVALMWTAYVFLYASRPSYTTGALLNFQDERNISAVADRGRTSSSSRATLLETNRLLGQVVRELKFNLSILSDNVEKKHLFLYLDVPENSVSGFYKLFVDGAEGRLLYTNEKLHIIDKQILTFDLEDTVKVNNFTFKLNSEYVRGIKKWPVEFKVRQLEEAIITLRKLVNYKWVDRRTHTNLIIQATHYSPTTAAAIANTMADKFVELDLHLRRRKTEEVVKVLNEQLKVAKQELDEANKKLQQFKERYPWVVPTPIVATGKTNIPGGGVALAPTGDSPISRIAALEEQKNLISNKISELKKLSSQFSNAVELTDKIAFSRELLTYLMSEAVPIANAYDAELTALITERSSLVGQYALSHSVFAENESKMNNVFNKILKAANDYLAKLEGQLEGVDKNVVAERYQLSRLPQKEREVTELIIDLGVKRDLYETILAKSKEARIKHEVEVGDVFVLDRASVPPQISKMSLIIKKAALGIFLGIGLGIALAFVLDFFDKTVQDSDELQSKLAFPILGSIPVIIDGEDVPANVRDTKGKRDTKLITLDYSPTLESESYRDLRTKLLFKNQDRVLSSFLVTSLGPSEGKSLTSSNLAITFAQQKISTVLIDGDLRRGVLHNVFGNKKKPGLSDFLISKATIDPENVNKLVQQTFIPNLYLISTGSPIPNPTELLGSERMQNLLKLLKSRFGMVIIDTAPFQASSDSAILSTSVDGVLVVVRAEFTNIELLSRKISEYDNLQQNILGLVLNMCKVDMNKERYQYSYYNY